MQSCYMLIATSHLLRPGDHKSELVVGYDLDPLQVDADHEPADVLQLVELWPSEAVISGPKES